MSVSLEESITHLFFFFKVYLSLKTVQCQQGKDLFNISQWTLDFQNKQRRTLS